MEAGLNGLGESAASQPAAETTVPNECSANASPAKSPVRALNGEIAVADNEASRLRELQANVRDQDDLERDISCQADRLLMEQADERDKKRLERTRQEKLKLETQILKMHQRLSQPIGTSARVRTQNELEKMEQRLSSLEQDLVEIRQRIDERQQALEEGGQIAGPGRLPSESRRDYLIRTGKITPFSRMGTGPSEPFASLHDALIDAEDEPDENEALAITSDKSTVSHRNLRVPGLEFDEVSDASILSEDISDRPKKKRRLERELPTKPREFEFGVGSALEDERYGNQDDYTSHVVSEEAASTSEDETEVHPEGSTQPANIRRNAQKDKVEDLNGVDDGNERIYQSRLGSWIKRRAAARERVLAAHKESPTDETRALIEEEAEEDECFKPHPTAPDAIYDNGFHIPGDIYPYLFDYQKTGVQWLWELYQQKVGGVIGDEMGLGKTIQVISFLAGLHYSKLLNKPAIVVCPATVMKQWVNEFHRWWPPFRVSILHTSGSGMINLRSESNREEALASQIWNPSGARNLPRHHKVAKQIVRRVIEEGHVLVTTYSGLQSYAQLLIPVDWGAAILDEGHKIRNPNTSITMYCKELRTPHRIILSGTPMQNNLTELWSLFDFVYPMRLGTLVNFRNQFEFPIRQGGYANASNLQVQTAIKCAETLKEAISPYLLQRFKVDVAADLPKKSEQVLFCKLTKPQRQAYEDFLHSDDMKAIMNGRRQVLYGVDILRKISNHPDLLSHKLNSHQANYGSADRSGKMQVVKALLELWKNTGHKALLFAQHRIMLDILQKFVKQLPGLKHRRMDGSTPIHHRQSMVDEFNTDPEIHVFLLTTKVGGLGINLTGADRVIIYDPDWNPSTDIQARERAWRLGQKRDVTVYRLMTAGTIEEKIYHRQIFKQFLTNKILKDPKQRQTFQMSDLQDLFSLGGDGPTETSQLFKHAAITYEETPDSKNTQLETKTPPRDQKQDISKVVGVSSIEQFQDGSDEISDNKSPGERSSSEARIMEGIFARYGVHSALEHENIVNGRHVRADPKIIEAEAKKVAAEAAEELRKAEEAAKSVPIGTPTWTGQFGVAGRPDEPSVPSGYGARRSTARGAGAGPSSASILANLAIRASSLRSQSSSPAPRTGPSGKDFIIMIRDFIISHGGSVYTKMLVDHFNRYCTTPQQSAEFKEILKRIAVLDQSAGRNGRGKWSLKPEYVRR